MNSKPAPIGWLVMPDQLFDPSLLPDVSFRHVYCCEHKGLIAYERFHVQRTLFYLAAMRNHVDVLRAKKFDVTHEPLQESAESFAERVVAWAQQNKLGAVHSFEVINKRPRALLKEALTEANIAYTAHPSPMFLTSNEQFAAYLQKNKRPFMRTFYEQQRKRLNLLIHPDESPVGGKWSFDEDNRKPLPQDVLLPDIPKVPLNKHVKGAISLCKKKFADHPGAAPEPWLPTTRSQALSWLNDFFSARFASFGPYEDAISQRNDVLFHSVLTPALNIGLLTPQEIIEKAESAAKREKIPLQSLEGFVRQIVGWREFIRGIYENFSDRQDKQNFFRHARRLSAAWYEANTGIPPLDATLNKVLRLGWAHHIERLMVLGNLMLLLEVHPHEAHRWFMEMFVDSSEWVMGPNVYGMALFSDGGIFATKPYICGSNYLRKMGGYKKGPWCDGVDGLYWRFVERHKVFLRNNARMQFAVSTIERMDAQRKTHLFESAEALQNRLTIES